jgi:mannose-6-phosphate isomerase-like protein (cupin superfamily)
LTIEIRRVIAGVRAGRSAVVADERLEVEHWAALRGFGLLSLWGWDEPPVLPAAPEPPEVASYYPGPGGVRFEVVVFPPEDSDGTQPDTAESATRLEERHPGLLASMDADGSGWHQTDTIDFGVVLAGEVFLCLEQGEVLLTPGTAFVQVGSRHAWRNRGRDPCTAIAVVVGVAGGDE